MLHISALLEGDDLAEVRRLVASGGWIDGRATAGNMSASVKHNRQLGEDDEAGNRAAAIVLGALSNSGVFASAALPAQISPPLFNRYGPHEHYGDHIDSAIRPLSRGRMRLDLSATLFLTPPEDYDGGELVIVSRSHEEAVKLAAGDLILYRAGSVHRVEPVMRGCREACFFWVQSLIRDVEQRDILFDLDTVIQNRRGGDEDDLVELTRIYHNLLRLWSDV